MFTQLFSVGIVPYEWKNAIVTPIFEKGLAGNVSNYLPVSLTCASSKLMERIISAAIYRHLLGNMLLSSTHHGFIKGKSTCTNLVEDVSDWTLAVQNRCGINVAYIYFSKAFDTVSYEKLFHCLYSYGIRDDLLRWLKNFLTGRTQQTRVGMALSELIDLLSGVIQGSSIGPVLFLIYLDGLAKLLEHHGITAKLFADDVKVYMVIENDLDAVKLQAALDIISEWANDWQLSVSAAKCSVLKIGRNAAADVDFRLDSCILPSVTHCRDLGVTITSDLLLTQYITELVSKAHRRANCIFYIGRY